MKNSPESIMFLEDDVKDLSTTLSAGIRYVILDEYTTVQSLRNQMITLYETPWCDPVYLNILNPSVSEDDCSKLFLYENEILKHIILFQIIGKRNVVLWNHCFKVSLNDIEIIRNIISGEYSNVKKITFPYLFLEKTEKRPLMVLYEKQADMIVELPESMDAYMKSLGSATRKSLRNSHNRIEKDNLNFQVSYYEGEKITREQITSLVKLNRDRMESKGKTSLNDDAECDRLFQYARIEGILCLCTVDEKIIGGTLMYALGEHGFSSVAGHDNAYNKYSIGSIVSVNEIRHMIETKRKYLHLLWGKQEYKYRFGAKEHYVYDVMAFQKRREFILNNVLVTIRSHIKTVREIGKNNLFFRKIRDILRRK